MVLVKSTRDSEAGMIPSYLLLAAMGEYNQMMAEAGVLLDGEDSKSSAFGRPCTMRRFAYGRLRPV